MKVNDSSAGTLEYNRNLDDKLRNMTKAKEKEIERIKDIYNKQVESAKLEGEDRYQASVKRNDEIIAGVGAEYEEKLKSYKESLDRTEKNIADSEIAFKNDHAEKMNSLKDQFNNNIHDEYSRAKENQDSVSSMMKSAVQRIQNTSRNEQKNLESKTRSYINALGAEFNQKAAREESDYRSRLEADKSAHEEAIRLQRTELKTMLDKNLQKGKQVEAEKMQVQKEELAFMENHQRDMILQRNDDFKIRYANMVKEHEAILSDLKKNLDADMKKMVESSTTQKRELASRSEDSFYRIQTLHPSVTDQEKDLIVSLKVPEYEKENVHLSVHGRDIKMTLTRKYTETMEAQDGSTNKSTKNELFSREFQSKDLLNSKVISQKYENGILSFKIPKL